MNTLEQAKQQHQLGHFDEAEVLYQHTLSADQSNVEALHFYAVLCAQTHKYEKAEELLARAIKLNSDDHSLFNHYGNVLKKLSRFDDASAAFHQALKLSPNFFEARNNLGALKLELRQYAEAEKDFKDAVEMEPNYIDALYNLGICFEAQEKLDSAISTFKQLLSITPENLAAQFHCGKCYFLKSDFKKAKQYFEDALKINPAHEEILTNLGACYLAEDDLAKAGEHYEKAADVNPENVEAHYNLGIIAEKRNNIDLAIQHYLKAEKTSPNDFAIQNNLGIAFIKRQNPQLALEHLKRAQAIDPHNENVNYKIEALQQSKHLEGAPHNYIKNLFDAYAHNFDQHLLESLDYQVPEQIHLLLQDHLKPESLNILDIGCGTGLMGEYIKPYAKKLVGVDLSEKMIEEAAKKDIYTELEACSLEDYLSTHKKLFNIIIAADVFVYTGKLDEIFKMVRKSLKRRGMFAFSIELHPDKEYSMLASGRFAHSIDYIARLSKENKFKLIGAEQVQTRTQYEKPVMGQLFLLQV